MRDGLLIVMAGGAGQRLTIPGARLPKPLTMVHDECLVGRQLRHAHEAGVTNVLVTTRPEFRQQFIDVLVPYQERGGPVNVLANPAHPGGSLRALLFVLDRFRAAEVLVTFADTYFAENPFALVGTATTRANLLGIGAQHSPPTMVGNVEVGAAKRITRIDYRSQSPGSSLWSGLTVWRSDVTHVLAEFLKRRPSEMPEEEFLQHCVDLKYDFAGVNIGAFVNVNTTLDLAIACELRVRERNT